METIMQILQWLVPSGIAGYLWAWLRHRENSKVIAAKERNDAYKEMYDNLSGTLIELQNENIKLNKAVRELNRTIRKASTCRHYNDCPIRIELQKSGGIDADQPSYRQPARQKRVRSPSAARSSQCGEDGISAEDIDLDTCGDGLQSAQPAGNSECQPHTGRQPGGDCHLRQSGTPGNNADGRTDTYPQRDILSGRDPAS